MPPAPKAGARLLLHSGLPLARPSSYSRQLRVLGRALTRRGLRASVRGPGAGPGAEPAARLLLGYPEQFPFLSGPSGADGSASGATGCRFLWAQYSRPPRPESLEGLVAVPLTEATAAHLRRAGVERIEAVIPHGVPTGLFRPLAAAARRSLRRRWGLGGEFVVGAVGAHTARKRFDLVLRAFAGFARRHPQGLLVLKTDRVRSLDGADLQALARSLGVEERARLVTGELGQAAMAGLYNCFDLLLNLSEWEGFGLPVVEALACGVPVVSLPGQGPGELVPYRELLVPGSLRREESGSLLLEARPEEAARVLLRAASDAPLRLRLSAEGRRRALEAFDIDAVAARWVELTVAG